MDTAADIFNTASKGTSIALSARMTHDKYKEYTTDDPEEKQYYKQKNKCHTRRAKRKLKVILIAIIIPLILMFSSMYLDFIPGWVPFVFMGWLGIGFIVLIIKAVGWAASDAKAALGYSSKECDELVKN
jgi:hypothetical protein